MRLFWAAAVGLAVIGGWLLWQQRAEKVEGKDLVPKSLSERYHNDVAPGGDRAILTLDNGTTIDLTSAQNGTLDVSSGAVAQKEKQGELTYYARPIKPGVHTYHLVTTPRGGQYRLTLSDGTIVWLNAASSLRYPVVFAGPTRHVELTGEAYFEVKPDELKPFIVKTAASQVKVLGTAFNLNTYADEPDQRITLVHGSVEISRDNARQRLKPGEQAQINNAGQIHVMAASDIESVTAWKEGSFVFRDSPIGPLLRQLARWYNINITIEQPVTQKFTVDISRTESLSQVLQLLEMTGGVHFTIDGSNVGVQP
ncbi:FecR family protein [Chitinophaga sp. S165]|uniref:FecR family protein n=1 Tax=Chitinophaga sp. S165 TaxID=2135462 RepID=UPI001304F072|nr:FecR domain-containing protein [Chitinophaga sp. S165]